MESGRPPFADRSEDPLAGLVRLPGVLEAVDEARRACERLRWHPALRRRAEECRAEAGVRAARCSAALEGARLPVDVVRDAVRGALPLPSDAAGTVAKGAVRAHAEAERLTVDGGRRLTAAPWQALARLHTAAAAGLLDEAELGRPRRPGEAPRDVPPGAVAPDGELVAARLEALASALSGGSAAPALVVAAVAHGELLALRPFHAGNGVVARALARAVVVGRGLDPTGVALPETALLADAQGYAAAARAYASGTPSGVAEWIRSCGRAMVAGAGEGAAVADAVLGGRLPRG